MITIDKITSELYKAYALFNKRFLKINYLQLLLLYKAHRIINLLWAGVQQKEVWSDKEGKIKLYEINISAEYLTMNF